MKYVQNTWLWCILGVLIILVLIGIVCKYIRASPPPPHDTFYYKVIDVNDNISCNHDSGIRPSQTSPGSIIHLQILKKEYNDGKLQILALPSTIKLGFHYHDMKWTLKPESVVDGGEVYIVSVIVPQHDLYNKKIFSSMDHRSEIIENSSE